MPPSPRDPSTASNPSPNRRAAGRPGDARIPYVTFLLPPSRRNLGALTRLGARFVGEVTYDGARFRKYRLETG